MASTDFYTSIELNNGNYIGRIFKKNNNQLVYTTPEYTSQTKMLDDTRRWFANQGTENIEQEPVSTPVNYTRPNVATNTVQYKTTTRPGKRCCGRR